MPPQRKVTAKQKDPGHARIGRLVKIIGHLQVGKGHNADSLSGLCNVSRRTIFRDLDVLRKAGVPLRFDEVKQRYSIPSNYYLPPTSFTPEEALAMIVLCQELGNKNRVPFLQAASNAALKLESSLPAAMRDGIRPRSDAVSIDLPAHNPLGQHGRIYHDLLLAIAHRRCVDMKYDSYSERESYSLKFSPYQLHFSRRSWYVIGRSAKHREVRTFNLGRISQLTLRDDTFELPQSFSLDKHFGNAWHMVKEGKDEDIVIHFSPLVARNVADVLWHKTQITKLLPDGSLEFRVTVAGLREISWWILGYGDQAKVIEPPALRHLITAQAQKTLDRYLPSKREK